MDKKIHKFLTKKLINKLDRRKRILAERGDDSRKDDTCNAYRAAIKDEEHPWRLMEWESQLQSYRAAALRFRDNKAKRKKKRKAKKGKAARVKKPSIPRTKSNVEWLPRDEWEKQTNKFYNSQAWKELRYEVLREGAGACACCGARASDGVRIHVDHIKPRSKYPELQLDKSNMQILCEDCNFGKSNYYDDDWRVKMESGNE